MQELPTWFAPCSRKVLRLVFCMVVALAHSMITREASAFSSLQVPTICNSGHSKRRSSALLWTDNTRKILASSSSCWLDHHIGRRGQPRISAALQAVAAAARDDDESDDDGDDIDDIDDDDYFPEAMVPDPARESPLSQRQVESLTVSQLQQQLRLRGLKVSGRKAELMNRLLSFSPITSSSSSFTSPMFTTTTNLDENDNDDESDFAVAAQDAEVVPSSTTSRTTNKKKKARTKAQKFAQEQGKEFIDVTAYLEDEDKGKDLKSWKNAAAVSSDDNTINGKDEEELDASNGDEVWGDEARIVDDYNGASPIVDGLSRSIVEFNGSNQTLVQAYVVASRDALKPFLAGGSRNMSSSTSSSSAASSQVLITTAAEERLRAIQQAREKANRRPLRQEDNVGLEEGDETGLYQNVLDRDFSDWGVYTQTGAQISAAEVQGVLLLSDVYGPFTDDTKMLVETIAFECQPVVVMAPDLFRQNPWKPVKTTTPPSSSEPFVNEQGLTYEEWRTRHADAWRVSIDIRAAAACLRQRYGVSSVVVWGTGYGGGRALEAAAGYLPNNYNVHDVNGQVGPPLVQPMVAVAWYPTRYNVHELFGRLRLQQQADQLQIGNSRDRALVSISKDKDDSRFAVMAVFAGNDQLEGATAKDAETLKMLLEVDERVKDHMVKVFPGQGHGFAHLGLSQQQNLYGSNEEDMMSRFVDDEFGGERSISIANDGDAQVACLLSTAFMETYSRVFLPTVGPLISRDSNEKEWGARVAMKDVTASVRDVRKELEEALDGFVEQPLGGYRIDPTDEEQEEELVKLLRSMEPPEQKYSPYAIEDDDDLTTVYAKLKAADDKFQIF
jgi:dienelactone hydrolase